MQIDKKGQAHDTKPKPNRVNRHNNRADGADKSGKESNKKMMYLVITGGKIYTNREWLRRKATERLEAFEQYKQAQQYFDDCIEAEHIDDAIQRLNNALAILHKEFNPARSSTAPTRRKKWCLKITGQHKECKRWKNGNLDKDNHFHTKRK